MLIALTCASICLGIAVERARKQREIVAWIERGGGYVRYDYQIDNDLFTVYNAKPNGPEWLRKHLDRHFFDTVVVVRVSAEVSDIRPLSGLNDLRTLVLDRTQVSDLTPLTGLTKLESLFLPIPVTDLSPLSKLTNLRSLYLTGTKVSDLSPLRGLTRLQALYLEGTRVSDLTPLSELDCLIHVDLRYTPVKDVSPLSGLGRLQVLHLEHTRVSDVTPLASLKNLEGLFLEGSCVTPTTVEYLRKALPSCWIETEQK